MQASTGQFAAVVAGASATVEHSVTLTLPTAAAAYRDVTLAVEQITVDRQLTTDMPDGTRLITGYPAAITHITLSGLVDQSDASKTIAWLLNPEETTSPLYRSDALDSPVVVQAGLWLPGVAAPEMFTLFTGTVDDYTVDVQGGTVTLDCLDYRSQFASTPPLPLGAFSSDVVAATYKPNALGQLLTSAWVLNYLCESLGLYTSPPPRSQAVFRQTNHGGAWPELGWNATHITGSNYLPDTPAYSGATWVPGKFATQVPTNSFSQYYNSPPVGNANGTIAGDIGSSGQQWFTECWIQPITSSYSPPGDAFLVTLQGAPSSVRIDLGAAPAVVGGPLVPYAKVITGAGPTTSTVSPASLTVPNDGQWHYLSIQFHFTSTTAYMVTFTVDGSSQVANGTHGAAVAAACPIVLAAPQHAMPCESIQVTNETAPPSNNGFVPSPLVDLDPSLNQLTAVPDVTGQDGWSVIQQIAQAEGGICGFTELGVFQFINRATLATQSDQRTITPTYSLKTLDQEMGNSFVRNHIQLPVNALQVQAPSTIWDTGSTVHVVDPHGTLVLYVTTDNPVAQVDTVGTVMPSGGGTPGLSYYRACTAPNGQGNNSTNLTMTVTQLDPTTLLIRVSNPNPTPRWLVSPTDPAFPAGSIGTPILRVGGVNITPLATPAESGGQTGGTLIADAQWPPLMPDGSGGAVTNPRGEKLLPLASNAFVQDPNSAQMYADDILIDLYRPRPLWRRTSIVLDPRLQLGDRVLIQDPDTTKVDGSALIIGMHATISRTDWNQSLDLRSIGAPGGWILGVPGKSELGVTTYV